MLTKASLLYEGKAKKIFEIKEDKNLVFIEFKDNLTGFNSKKKGEFPKKGTLNRNISSFIFRYLKEEGLSTHWVKDYGENSFICHKVEIIPLEIVIRNRLAGSTAKRLKLKEGHPLSTPLFEIYYKKDELDDPFINEDQALFLGAIQSREDLLKIKKEALLINEKLKLFFKLIQIELIDFKIEFGRVLKEQVQPNTFLLSDEISPDSSRLWDFKTGEKLDKDRFRYNLGRVKESYEEVYQRIKNQWGKKK